MTTYEGIIYKKQDGYSVITMNRPNKLNALDAKTAQEMIAAFEDSKNDDDIRAAILTGTGRAFCTGADMSSGMAITDPRQPDINRSTRIEPFVSVSALAKCMRAFTKPLIAAVNGTTTGMGFSLACIADIRFASEEARFSSIWAKRALVADCGLTYTLPRIIGVSKTLEMMWFGEFVAANEAASIGLVSKVFPAAELMPKAEEFAAKLAKGPAISIELTKKLIYDGLDANNFSSQLAYETWANGVCTATEDFKDAFNAFINKTQCDFKGR